MKKRPLVLSIAGFDPTGGAGVLADIKAFEQNKVQGMAVITGNTIQSEDTFLEVDWVDESFVEKQLDLLIEQYQFKYIKIGLIPNLDFLKHLLSKPKVKAAKIIWDPILKASSGYDFKHHLEQLKDVLPSIYLITPNWDEVKVLSNNSDAQLGAELLAKQTNVYLKGGHSDKQIGKDYLYTTNGKVYPFNPMGNYPTPKHGSGCVLSSSLAANFAREFPVIKACLRAKKYTTEFLESDKGLLGSHKK